MAETVHAGQPSAGVFLAGYWGMVLPGRYLPGGFLFSGERKKIRENSSCLRKSDRNRVVLEGLDRAAAKGTWETGKQTFTGSCSLQREGTQGLLRAADESCFLHPSLCLTALNKQEEKHRYQEMEETGGHALETGKSVHQRQSCPESRRSECLPGRKSNLRKADSIVLCQSQDQCYDAAKLLAMTAEIRETQGQAAAAQTVYQEYQLKFPSATLFQKYRKKF